MNLLFFLTPKQDVLFVYEDFTLRQALEKWSNQRFATIPVLRRNGEYIGTISEGDLLWGIKNIHGLDLDASEDVPISSFPRRRNYKAVPVTTDMRTLVEATVDQNFVPVVDDRNVFIGIVPRTAIIKYMLRRMDSSSETTQISTRAIKKKLMQQTHSCLLRKSPVPALYENRDRAFFLSRTAEVWRTAFSAGSFSGDGSPCPACTQMQKARCGA